MKKLLSFLFGLVIFCSSYGQLTAGDIMIVGISFDGEDGFSILALRDIAASSTIYFSDRIWDNGTSTFDTGSQNSMTWVSDASVTPAGTVITFENVKPGGLMETVTSGSITSGGVSLNNGGDRIFIFLGTDDVTPTTFLSAFSNEDIQTNGSDLPPSLMEGVNVTEFTNNDDVFAYNGSTVCNTTVADCAAAIANTANWSSEGGTGDQSADAGDPDFPADVPASFSGSALPVELVTFSWESKDGRVHLVWETASELNNLGFYLEKSLEGEWFDELVFVHGNGTSTVKNSYSYSDQQEGSAYYKLTQEDFDGTAEVIGLIFVNPTLDNQLISVYPNPTKGAIILNGQITSYRLVDTYGRTLLKNGYSTTSVAIDELSNFLSTSQGGTYFLISRTNDKEQVIRVFKE